ncbi:hypothetical protein KDA_70040 [Dictyobacter alpinus]|uniref:Uncharacterized protein n=1 Tax=Dictyobacter alpinus TaxID=2014873 RepID=A0A402BJK2_9CHLR|nr:hypothetical protein [Dictyobacter alpinus]GCE31520.1 hypothetical protein KDA_70040 [Dictyobacter alpinus]
MQNESFYDVAIWRYWPSSDLPYVAFLNADVVSSALVAALHVMAANKLKHVARVAVKCPDRSYQRWEHGLTLYQQREEIPAYD